MAEYISENDFNKFKGYLAAIVALVLLGASGLAIWGKNFATSQVTGQLEQEKISFPPEGSPGLDPETYPGLQQYAGQQVDSGPKAKAYADEFIYQHMMEDSGGKTYAEISAAERENPGDKELAEIKESLFRGSALRSMLLTAYAFSVFGVIAGYAAIASLIGAALMIFVAAKYLLNNKKSVQPESNPSAVPNTNPATPVPQAASESQQPADHPLNNGPNANSL